MYRLIPLSLVLFSTFIAAISQIPIKNFELVRGIDTYVGHPSTSVVIGAVDKKVFMARWEKKQVFLEAVSESARVVKSVELNDLTYNSFEKRFTEAFIRRGRLFLLFEALDKKNKTLYYIIDEYNPADLSFKENVSVNSENMEAFAKVTFGPGNAVRSIDEMSEDGFDFSNEAYVVEYSSSFVKDKRKSETINLHVFDSNMKIVWSQNFTLPYTNDKFEIRQVIVDQSGNVHMLGSEARKEKRVYHVFSFTDDGSNQDDYELLLDQKYIKGASIAVNAEGNVIVGGFYGNTVSDAFDGSFMFRIDVRKQKLHLLNLEEFTTEFIQRGMTENETTVSDKLLEEKKDLSLRSFDMRQLIRCEEGWILLAEQDGIFTFDVGSTTQVTHYCNDIIAVKFNSEGKIEWHTKIDKYQSGENSTLSHLSTVCNGKIYLVYSNKQGTDQARIECAALDQNGEVVIQQVMALPDGWHMHTRYSGQTKDCQMLLYITGEESCQLNLMNMQ